MSDEYVLVSRNTYEKIIRAGLVEDNRCEDSKQLSAYLDYYSLKIARTFTINYFSDPPLYYCELSCGEVFAESGDCFSETHAENVASRLLLRSLKESKTQ